MQSEHAGGMVGLPEAESDDDSITNTGSDEAEESEEEDDADNIEHDFDNPFHDMDEPFDMRNSIPLEELLGWADANDKTAMTKTSPGLEFGPKTEKPRRLEIDLNPLTAKNIGYVKKIHSIATIEDRGDRFYNKAMAASDFTQVGYISGIVVCVVCCRLEPQHDDGATLHVESLDVLKAYRRRRMASQLLVWVLQQASRRKGNTIRICEVSAVVPVSNTAAVALFREAFGFKASEEFMHGGEASYRFTFPITSDA